VTPIGVSPLWSVYHRRPEALRVSVDGWFLVGDMPVCRGGKEYIVSVPQCSSAAAIRHCAEQVFQSQMISETYGINGQFSGCRLGCYQAAFDQCQPAVSFNKRWCWLDELVAARDSAHINGCLINNQTERMRHLLKKTVRAVELKPGKYLGVYVLASDRYVKIGRSGNVAERVRTLNGQGCPDSVFRFVGAVSIHDGQAGQNNVSDCVQHVEKAAHVRLAEHRVSGEWFGVTPDEAMACVREMAGLS
jgi:hypothetical protein